MEELFSNLIIANFHKIICITFKTISETLRTAFYWPEQRQNRKMTLNF